MPQQEIDDEVAQLAELMRRFTPSVEPSKDQPGADNYKYLLQPNLLLR